MDSTTLVVPLGALALGLIFGATVQRSHFCRMGGISDAVLFGSFRRLRVWALAIAVALLGSQALDSGRGWSISAPPPTGSRACSGSAPCWAG